MSRKIGALFLVAILFGCGSEEPAIEHFEGDEYFPPPAPIDRIAPRWQRIVGFGVKDRPEYDAVVEVALKGVSGGNSSTRCEFLTEHRRIRTDRPWSPLPFAFYTITYQSPDGAEDLHDLFRLTLDFTKKVFDAESMAFDASFTRAKVFSGSWRILPRLVSEGGKESCSAIAIIDRSAQVECRTSKCTITNVIAEVDSWRHIFQGGKSEREKDDLSGLFLNLKDLDSNNNPQGESYTVRVPEFK